MKNYIKILMLSVFAIASCTEEDVPVVKAVSLTMSETNLVLSKEQTCVVTATILPENVSDKTLVWKSTKESVATVDNNGLISAVDYGTAYIVATNPASALMSACMVTVGYDMAIYIDKFEGENTESFPIGPIDWETEESQEAE